MYFTRQEQLLDIFQVCAQRMFDRTNTCSLPSYPVQLLAPLSRSIDLQPSFLPVPLFERTTVDRHDALCSL